MGSNNTKSLLSITNWQSEQCVNILVEHHKAGTQIACHEHTQDCKPTIEIAQHQSIFITFVFIQFNIIADSEFQC